jgi:ankyrin repeat protein
MMIVRTRVLGNTLDSNTADEFRSLFASSDWIEEGAFTTLHKIVLGLSEKDLAAEMARNVIPVDARASCGSTALMWAAMRGNIEHIHLLIAHGANLNASAKHGLTPLKFAVLAKEPKSMIALLKAGADVNVAGASGEFTALFMACAFMRPVSFISVLLAYGASVNVASTTGATPISWSARLGQAAVVRCLLEAGADPDVTATSTGNGLHGFETDLRPLQSAVYYNFHDVAVELLAWGADRSFIGSNKKTILHIAAERADVRMMNILRDAEICDVDINAVDGEGRTARMVFEYRESWRVAHQETDKEVGLDEAFGELLFSVLMSNGLPIEEQFGNIDPLQWDLVNV